MLTVVVFRIAPVFLVFIVCGCATHDRQDLIATPGNSGVECVAGVAGIPSVASGIAAVGTLAYIGGVARPNHVEPSRLYVVDINAANSPAVVGVVDIPYDEWRFALSVAVAGERAYLADGTSGLRIIDVGVATAPALVDSVDTPDNARDVAVAGDYAYIADSSGLQVIDISGTLPTIVGSVETPGLASGIAVVGNMAYVADRHAGLQLVDVSDPRSPKIVHSVDTPGYARDVAVSGNYAYVADGASEIPPGSPSLQVIDVSVASSAAAVGSVGVPGFGASAVAASGNYAYVATSSGVIVIDVTEAASPRIIGTVAPLGNTFGAVLGDIATAGDYVYFADPASGMVVVDLSDPACLSD